MVIIMYLLVGMFLFMFIGNLIIMGMLYRVLRNIKALGVTQVLALKLLTCQVSKEDLEVIIGED